VLTQETPRRSDEGLPGQHYAASGDLRHRRQAADAGRTAQSQPDL